MRFSEHWLRTMADPPVDTATLCDTLTMAGLEVEECVPAAPPFTNVVVGRIDKVETHPNAERLRVCTVDVGAGAPLSIVCGAPNAAAGMHVPCARVGAALPGDVAIRQAAVRGVESVGNALLGEGARTLGRRVGPPRHCPATSCPAPICDSRSISTTT